MARVCQINQCATLSVNKSPKMKIESVNSRQVAAQYTLSRSELLNTGFTNNVLVLTFKLVKLYGTEYKIGLFVVMYSGKSEPYLSDFPIFGQVKEIIIISTKIYLWCLNWKTFYLDDEFNAYCIKSGITNEFIYCFIQQQIFLRDMSH